MFISLLIVMLDGEVSTGGRALELHRQAAGLPV